MRIFLADTVHSSMHLSPNTVPYNVGRVAAYCHSKQPWHAYELFKDPHQLIARLKTARPDVLAISNYFWNSRLNHRIIRFARVLHPDLLVVVGGPNLDRNPDAYRAYASQHPYVDFVVVDEGETSFEAIVATFLSGGTIAAAKEADVPGTFSISGPGSIHLSPSRPRVKSLDELPSPYANGMLDPFLDAGMDPIVEFVRGCPYQCAFCEQGSGFFTKLAQLSLDRAYAEVEYIRERTKTSQLIIADVNFGILGRDLEIARYLKNSYREHGWPKDVYLYNAKVPTKVTLECMETLHPMAALCMSFQSTDLQVLKNIHRSNIGYDKYSFMTRWAKERGIAVGTELIYGLPGESRDTFIKGYEKLLGFRADYMSSYNLRLFAGIELNTPQARERYKVKTRFRPMDINLGEYQFQQPERIIEVEEIVLSTSTASEEDFFYVREVAFMVESLWNTGYLRPALAFLANLGSSITGIFDEVLGAAKNDPHANEFFLEYRRLARSELANSPQEFIDRCGDDDYWDNLVHGKGVNLKLNLAFAGRLMFFENKVDEFLYKVIGARTADLLPAHQEAFADILAHCRSAKFDLEGPEVKHCDLIYDVPAWIAHTYPTDVSPYRLGERETFSYTIPVNARNAALRIKERLGRKGASLSSIAERIMMGLPKAERPLRVASRSAPLTTQETDDARLVGRMSWS